MPLTIEELLVRWDTDEGKELLQMVVAALLADQPCADILSGLPGVAEIKSGLDLRHANLSGANLGSADLSSAAPISAKLRRALYDDETQWPGDADYKTAGAIHLDDVPADE